MPLIACKRVALVESVQPVSVLAGKSDDCGGSKIFIL